MGIFSRFGKKKRSSTSTKKETGVNNFLSFVMFNEYADFNEMRLLEKYNEICDVKLKATDIQRKENTVTFTIDGSLGFVSFMPAPFPWSDLEGPCQTSWMWKEAAEELKNHKQHIIISWMTKEKNPLLISKVVSQITASVLEEVKGIGVYWGGACLVNKKDVFCGMVYDIDTSGLPLFLWVDFRIEKHENSELNLITYGLHNYGIMELEIIKTSKPLGDLIDFALNIARYLIDNGNVIKDGDTVGEDENQKIIATHKPSVWSDNNRGTVLAIEY